jgi:hypothetical protein
MGCRPGEAPAQEAHAYEVQPPVRRTPMRKWLIDCDERTSSLLAGLHSLLRLTQSRITFLRLSAPAHGPPGYPIRRLYAGLQVPFV